MDGTRAAATAAVEAHDPGGRTRSPLPPGMRGDALFSGCGRYRHWLSREWGGAAPGDPHMLWIGMNPSTARHDVNDPTIVREYGFTERLTGMRAYAKMNVADYRATDPKALVAPGVVARSPVNLPMIRERAADAAVVVMACGLLPRPLRHLFVETVEALRRDSRDLWCLGTTADGTPKHPLYLKASTPLVRFG